MYWLLGSPRSVTDLKSHQRQFTASDRQKVQIAVIDDEELPYLDTIKRHDFNIRTFRDIEDVQAVHNYPVVLCDIRGVGKHFQSQYEGAHLLSEIRKRYPTKVLLAYTAHQTDPSYNRYFQLADRVLKKDIDSDEWIDRLDESIQLATDPLFQWKRFRSYLLDKDIPLIKIVALEDAYVSSIEKKSQSHLSHGSLVNGLPDEVKHALVDLSKTVLLHYLGAKS
jgi:hypothetical protein